MDNKNPSLTKLAGLRTFAKDQEKNTGVKINETPVSVAPVVKVITPPKLTSIDREIRKINKGEKEPEPAPIPKVTEPKIPTPPPTPVVKPIPVPEPKPEEVKNPVIKENTEAEKPVTHPTPLKSSELKTGDKNAIPAQATIITDTKKPRFKLFSSIIESIKSWFSTKPSVSKIKKESVPKLKKAEQKKGLETATWETEKSAANGQDTIKDQIDQRLEEGTKEQNNKTIWTPNTETGFLLLDEPDEHITNVQVVPRASFYTSQREIIVGDREELSNQDNDFRWNPEAYIPEPEIVEPEIPTPPPTPVVKPTPAPVPKPEAIATEIHEPIVEVPKVEPAPAQPKVQPIVVETPSLPPVDRNDSLVKEKTNLNEPSSSSEDHKDRKNLLLQTSTNTLSFIIAVIVLAILIITGVASNLFTNDNSEKELTAKNYPRALDTELRFVFQPMVTKASLIDRINLENRNTNNDVNQFVFTASEDYNNPIKPSNLLNYLEINPPANFIQSISGIYFGSVSQENPFIIFKNTDNVTARGGMLAWEDNMRTDLALILKLGTDLSTSTEKIEFIDGMIGEVDVRVLKSGNGEDEIIYGFANRDTILITESSATFGELLKLIRP